ncbi:MAG: hypothetical protein QG635_1096, partial [Bacteroidota bacterium]|nr:hypothetical protein [Bacteroidota bacterium]
IRESKTFDVEPSAKFIEVNKDLYVKRLNEGLVLNKLDAFADGGKDLSDEAKTKLEELKEILKFNRSAKFVIKINAHDTYSQKYFAPEPANKNKNKGKKSSTPKPEQNTPAIDPQIITALVDARVNEIKKITDTWGSFGQRVSFAPDYTVGEPSQIKLPDLMLVVGKIENVFRKSEGD